MKTRVSCRLRSAAFVLALIATPLLHAQQNVLQPGDPIIASSANSPGSEGVANAIDGKTTKYLNFDSGRDGAVNKFSPSGFVVTPSVGVTRVTGIAMESANDSPNRDPKAITLEGSNDDTITAFNSGSWELITTITNIPAWTDVFPGGTDRFKIQTFNFDNFKPFKHYRWVVTETQTTPNGCCMQIAEVQLLGRVLPPNVVQPGDAIIASSANSPGSEGVANAIDGKTTKYLNFDSGRDGAVNKFSPSGFVVTPSIGKTLVTGIAMESANDSPNRDPKAITLEGSNDDTITAFNSGTWELITTITNIPAWTDVFPGGTDRFKVQTFLFNNYKPYAHYRWVVTETQTTPNGCCMQIAEVQFLGSGAPKNVVQPGDAIIASSANSPGSEGVANAIDGKTTKYLNFDSGRDGAVNKFSPSGFVVTPSIGATTVIGLSMESANDSPNRDPKSVTLEGSNDDTITAFNSGTWVPITTITNIPAWTDLFPGGTDRFKTQEFYFPNNVSYKHYRWLVTETQTTPNGCCMQIAEVGFLAESLGADCNKARFLVQPQNTPVLDGAAATLSVTLNGPWPIQWLKNGQPIPGATLTTYTTDPVNAQNQTNVYQAQIVGCAISTPVTASIFTPSTTKSIGISFIGGGANGAPTSMTTNDIAGIQLQGHWNNLSGGTGSSSTLVDTDGNPLPLLDSSNNASDITFDWATSGTWGSGTGDTSPTLRLLNGVVYANPGTTATLTFGNVPAGSHSVIAYTVNIPLQFQNANFVVAGDASQTNYVRTMNSDEYNAAPGFYGGTSTDPAARVISSYVRFDNVHPDASGNIVLSWDTITTGYDRGAAVGGVQLVLNSTAVGAAPVITTQPKPTVVQDGKAVTLTVAAIGSNLTYQWRKNGRNIPDGANITGTSTANLTISPFTVADEGIYSVAVFNPAGSSLSKNSAVHLSQFNINEGLAAYLKLDETSGSNAANAATGGVKGVVNGVATWGAGKITNSLTFDGGTYVQVDNYTKAKAGISASAWVNIDAAATASAVIIRNGQGGLAVGGTNSGQFDFSVVADATDGMFRPSVVIAAGPNLVRATGTAPLPLGTWQNIAFSADGAQLRLYVNGQVVATTDYSGTINTPQVNHLSLGAVLAQDDTGVVGPDGTTPNYLSGSLDDVAVWTRGLTDTEVAAIYTAGAAGKPLSTVVETPPVVVQPGHLTITRAAANVTITYDHGTLQSAPAVTGPWTPIATASPVTEAISGSAKFYRTVSQ